MGSKGHPGHGSRAEDVAYGIVADDWIGSVRNVHAIYADRVTGSRSNRAVLNPCVHQRTRSGKSFETHTDARTLHRDVINCRAVRNLGAGGITDVNATNRGGGQRSAARDFNVLHDAVVRISQHSHTNLTVCSQRIDRQISVGRISANRNAADCDIACGINGEDKVIRC